MSFLSIFILAFFISSSVCICSIILVYSKKQKGIKEAHLNPLLDSLFDFAEDITDAHSHASIIEYIQLFEKQTNAKVLFLDYSASRLVYVDWSVFNPLQVQKIEKEFNSLRKSYAFFNSNMNRTRQSSAEGFVLKSNGNCLFVFFPHVREGNTALWQYISSVFSDFTLRCALIDDFLNKTLFSRQLFDIEKMQYTFLPQEMPKITGLEVSSYFLPLITVSGDYYSVIPITKTKTLFLLGDVSGKGLSAALVMGVIMNVVNVFENKEDLVGLMSQIDNAVKLMRLGDKFTVVFSAIIDTSVMRMDYINASLADAYVLSSNAEKVKITTLSSTCSLLGVEGVTAVTEHNLRTFPLCKGDSIILASDGLSEVGHSTGTCFGDTQLYKKLLLSSLEKPLDVSVKQLADNALKYSKTTALKDDITILAVRMVG